MAARFFTGEMVLGFDSRRWCNKLRLDNGAYSCASLIERCGGSTCWMDRGKTGNAWRRLRGKQYTGRLNRDAPRWIILFSLYGL